MKTPETGAYLDRLIRNIRETRFEDLPAEAVRHAKDRLIDTLGCLVCGAGDSGNAALLGLIRDWGGRPEARVLVYGDRVPAPAAVQMNCVMARSFDFEPVSPLVDGQSIPGHISGTTVTTALTLGDMRQVNGRELLAALLAGDDLATRVLLAGRGSGTRLGFDHVGQANSFGATAVAGRLLGLDSSQLRHAFGLILDHLGGAQRQIVDTATGFKLSQGNAARDAVFCVRLAGAGWSGVEDALLSAGGYYDLYTDGIKDPELLVRDLGRAFYSDMTFKPYPCCRMNHAAIDCALDLVNNQGVRADDIRRVIISISAGALQDIIGQPFRIRNSVHASAGFSVQYNVASVLLRGSSRPEHFTDQAIRDPAVGDFIRQKIEMAELTEGGRESARIRVVLRDGRELEQYAAIARGDPARPITRAELLAKYRGNIAFSQTVSAENAEKVLQMVEDLENLPDVRCLVDLLMVRA